MLITSTKRGIKVQLQCMPNGSELEQLNQVGNFYICEKRGYKRLIQRVPSPTSPFIYTEWECPINQAFFV